MRCSADVELHRADGGPARRELPERGGWQYEPKWDGFRCIAARDGAEVGYGPSRASRSPAISPRSRRCSAGSRPEAVRHRRRAADRRRRRDLLRRAAAAAPPRGQPRAPSWPPKLPRCSWPSTALRSAQECWPASRSLNAARRSSRCWPRKPSRCLLLSPATARSGRSARLAGAQRRRARRRHRQAAGPALPARRAGDGQGQAAPHRRLRGRRLPLRPRTTGWSARCCSASTTMPACCIMSASPPSIAAKDRPAWTEELEKLIEPPGFTGNAPAGRAAGRPSAPPNGSRSSRRSSSRCSTTRSPPAASATAPGCSAGAPTRRRGNAPAISSPTR